MSGISSYADRTAAVDRLFHSYKYHLSIFLKGYFLYLAFCMFCVFFRPSPQYVGNSVNIIFPGLVAVISSLLMLVWLYFATRYLEDAIVELEDGIAECGLRKLHVRWMLHILEVLAWVTILIAIGGFVVCLKS